jgi:hypothetical protein
MAIYKESPFQSGGSNRGRPRSQIAASVWPTSRSETSPSAASPRVSDAAYSRAARAKSAIVGDRHAPNLLLTHEQLDIFGAVVDFRDANIAAHCIGDLELVQRFPLKESCHADVTIGQHADDSRLAVAVARADRQAPAVVVPHARRGVIERVIGAAVLNVPRHHGFERHASLLAGSLQAPCRLLLAWALLILTG